MADCNAAPGQPLSRVTLPENWERAYGYAGQRRFIAVWWQWAEADTPARAMVDDGIRSSPVAGWPYFVDLTGLLLRSGYGRERLAYCADPPTHCALLDLQQRRLYHAPLDDALAWIHHQAGPAGAPGAKDISDDERWARLQTDTRHLCPIRGSYGWRRQTPYGYAPCDVSSVVGPGGLNGVRVHLLSQIHTGRGAPR